MASLLSCVKLLPNRRPASLSALLSLVNEANSVLSLHIETALLYLREPSFQANTFSQLAHLLRNVLTNRLDGLKALQRFRLGSEKKLVSILIELMLPILLLYEETSITEGNEPLCWDNPHGLLQSIRCSWPADQCVLPLLDKLAKCRDKQWEKERLKKNELVATLDEGWPKGLPIQCLLPSEEWMRQALAHPEAAPFVAERVEKVVFCDAKEAFTAVPPDTDAIGPFVDSLQIAIPAYVGQKPATNVLNRIERVWGHYTHVVPLAAGYVEMVKSILKHIASIAEVDWMKEAVKPRVPPSLPASEMHTADLTPIEWDPRTDSDSSSNITTESNNLGGFTANLLLSRFTAMEHVGPAQWRFHTFVMPQNRSLVPQLHQSERRDSIWEVWNDKIRQLPLANRDALVASAMLYVDAFAAGNSRLLSKPFPVGMRHPRYPAMYLDYEFLSEAAKAGDYIDYAIVALEKLSTIIPVLLLQQLANSMLDKLIEMSDKDSVDHILESATFRIIAILSRTDQPHLASSLGLRIIKEMPYSSSWHRRVISARLCNRLSPHHIKEMLENFAHFILNFLRIQEESRKTKKLDTLATGEDPTLPTQEYAKVTTIKLLVELLERGDLVSSEVSVDMLRSLFFKSNHIDVKHAALRSVMGLLQKSSKLDVELRSMLYKTLISFSAAAAGPNERYTASEEEWLAAENCGVPPECSNDRPLLYLFLIEGHRIPYKLHEAYVHDVLFTILHVSTRQHDRWMRIFLGRINVQPEDVGVTDFGPFDNKFADKLLSKWTNNIPKGFLKRHRELSMRYLYCDNLGDINEKLSAKDPLWKQTNAGEHWIYYLKTHKSYESAFKGLGTIIQMGKISRSYDFGEVTNDDVEDEYCQRVAIAVRNPRYYLGDSPIVSMKPFEFAFGHLLFNNDLAYIFSTSASGVEKIRLSRRQPLERIIADVESLHTESWLSSSSRNPPVLPSIWRLQYYLIRALPATEQLEYIDSLAEQCAQSIFITDDFDYLAIAVSSVPPDDQITLLLGLGKAAQNDHNTALGCIKVHLAHNIMQQVRNLDKSKRSAEIKSLLGSWLKSSNEFIRKLAFHELERISLSKGEVVSELDL